ncbi:hypothetical protein BDDG_12451 [Blastomyces dermatitidis ATCC 18188]|uniref:Uncharacterized protein n=1 Tax=Ajellomyces dermatitidis (strain ATCC 18188 / CBS 674.68) TaxID=653446 RepID=A0A0J9EPK0_AJEDA|nr:hypothetical protein BDFG_05070 [Blastomyces dermatitidis ATCC 26199]KMW67936.1 hypothetical protein BDDG_12451 [Blastomyces dermatitidis ATCC 18188]
MPITRQLGLRVRAKVDPFRKRSADIAASHYGVIPLVQPPPLAKLPFAETRATDWHRATLEDPGRILSRKLGVRSSSWFFASGN